jgi:hypothetical protein
MVESASEDEQVVSLARASASALEPAGHMALACRIPRTAPPPDQVPGTSVGTPSATTAFMGPASYASACSLLDNMEERERRLVQAKEDMER